MDYLIMPNYIHIILAFDEEVAGASPRPTIMDVILHISISSFIFFSYMLLFVFFWYVFSSYFRAHLV